MMKYSNILCMLMACLGISACVSNVYTGANLIYDRHSVYKKTTDVALAAKIGHSLKLDPMLQCPSNRCFELTVFHNDVLLLGVVPSFAEKKRANDLVKAVGTYRYLYNYIEIKPNAMIDNSIDDDWITTKIRSQIMANADIDPGRFKIVTHHQVVYLLGDVMDGQDEMVIDISRKTQNVTKVVNLLHTYMLKPKRNPIPPPVPNFPIANNSFNF